MDITYIVLYIIISILLIALISFIIYSIFKSPFKYPYHIIKFDITGKRTPNINDLIDNHLNMYGFNEFLQHYEKVKQWKIDNQERINKSKIKKLRTKQFEKVVDDEHMFRFELMRKQTRYRQQNYVKSAYTVNITIAQTSFNLNEIQQRYDALANIDFECTLSEYNSKEQRKQMTPALREKISIRDNFTCQCCGKFMPDGVGLHIDHIIPIRKGGKSISSNLQVLCSKCNGKKSSK